MLVLCLCIQELVDVFNNVLNETNEAGWTELQTISSGSQTLLQNAERYGTYLATTVNDTDESLMLVRENISELYYVSLLLNTLTNMSNTLLNIRSIPPFFLLDLECIVCPIIFTYLHTHCLYCAAFVVVAAEVVDASRNISDVVFPQYSDQLDNFTAMNVSDTVQVTIPGDALNRITDNSTASGQYIHCVRVVT